MQVTVGRMVFYRPRAEFQQDGVTEFAAIVTMVRGDRCNLMVMPPHGVPYPVQSVAVGEAENTWRWPPRV